MLRYFLFTVVGSLAAIALWPTMKALGSTVSKYFRKIDDAADEIVKNNAKKEETKDGENTENL